MDQLARVQGVGVTAQAENPEVTKVVMGWVIFWLIVGGFFLHNWWMAAFGAGVSALFANTYMTDDRVPRKRLIWAGIFITGFFLVATSHVLLGVEAFPGTPVQTFDCGTTFSASRLGGGVVTYIVPAQSLPSQEEWVYVMSACGPALKHQSEVMYVALGLAILAFIVMVTGSRSGSPKPPGG